MAWQKRTEARLDGSKKKRGTVHRSKSELSEVLAEGRERMQTFLITPRCVSSHKT